MLLRMPAFFCRSPREVSRLFFGSLGLMALAALLAPVSADAGDGWEVRNSTSAILSSGTVTGVFNPGNDPVDFYQEGGAMVSSGTIQLGTYKNMPPPNFYARVDNYYQFNNGLFQANGMNLGLVNAGIPVSFAGSGDFDQNGGRVNLAGSGLQIQTTDSSYKLYSGTLTTTRVAFGYGSPTSGNHGNFYLHGGVLETSSITVVQGTGSFLFNGGTLRATGDSTWFNSGFNLQMTSNGATIDTAGYTATIGSSIQFGDINGVGLTKVGEGTLVFTTANGYGGPTNVTAGTLRLAVSTALSGSSTLNVSSGATGAFNVGGAGEYTWAMVTGRLGGFAAGSSLGLDTTNAAGGNYTISDAINGNFGLTKLGLGTLTLTGSLGYTGTTLVTGGTLSFAGQDRSINSLAGTGGWVNLNSFNLAVNQTTTGTLASNITGVGGSFTKNGSGKLIFSGSNSYTGATTVNAGVLQFSRTSALASGPLTVNAGATGGFSIGGAGEFTWSQISSIVGTSFRSGSFLGLDPTNVAGGSYTLSEAITNSGTAVLGLSKLGQGTLVLTGTNTYTGGTRVTEGMLQFAKTSALSSTGTLTVNAGATGAFNVGGAGEFTWAGISGVTSGYQAGSWLGLDTTNAGGSFTIANSIAGNFGIIKLGTGALVLSGSNSFAGGVRVGGSVVEFANANSLGAASGAVTLSTGTLRWGAGNTADISSRLALGAGGGTIDTNGNTVAFGSAISGTGALVKGGAGTLRLHAANAHSGDTTVNAGALALAGPAASGGQLGVLDGSRITINGGSINIEADNALAGATPSSNILLTINTGGTLATVNNVTMLPEVLMDGGSISITGAGNFSTGNFYFTDGLRTAGTGKVSRIQGGAIGLATPVNVLGTDTLQISSALVGPNILDKQGSGTLVLTGANTYATHTVVGGGVIDFNSANALGSTSSRIFMESGTLRWASGNTADLSSRITLNAAGGSFDTNGNNVTFSSTVVGAGALTKTGAGLLTLSATNTYTGGTVVNGGTLKLNAGGAIGAIRGALTINTGATVESAVTNAFGFATGLKVDSVTINGGTLNHTAAADCGWGVAYTLSNGALMTSNGGVSNANATTQFAFGGGTGSNTSVNVTSGTATIAGHVDLRGDNGNTNVNFTVASGATLNLTAGISSHSPDALTVGPVGFTKLGGGTLILTGSNIYSGTTSVNAGVVDFNNANAFGNGGTIAVNSGTLRWTSNTADLSSRLSLGAGGVTFDTNGNTVSFASAISGTGALTKTGAGLLRLSSSNSHSGDTTVNGGVLVLAGPTSTRGQLGGLDNTKITINSGNINLETNNALVGTSPFGNILITINTGGLLSTVNNTTMLSEVLMDGGVIETAGGGDFTNGNYIFSDGLRTAGTGKTSYIQGGAVVLPTAVNVGAGDTLRVASVIMGNNNLVKQGAGTMVLTGSNTFTGTTLVSGGLIEFSSNTNFGNAANKITLNGAGLRWATGNTADISGRLNAFGVGGASFDTNGNIVTLAAAMSGAGALTKNGAGTLRLTGSNTYIGGTVINSGTLAAAQNNALGTGAVQVKGGALFVEDNMAFSNTVVLAGGTYSRAVTGSLAGKVNASSDFAGGTDTTARILAGSLGTTSTLVTSFSVTSAATNDFLRESDVYSFVGTGTTAFVLELSAVSLTGGEIGWLSSGEWVYAVDGNTGNTATEAMQGFDGSYAEFLVAFAGVSLAQSIGAYGYDEETHAAWAVLNHNSDFAVIPEPATAGLLVMGGLVLLVKRRRA